MRREAPLADERDTTGLVEREDRDGAGMRGEVADRPRSVGPLDRDGLELDERAPVEDARVDDALTKIGPGGILRGRWLGLVRSVGQTTIRRQAAAAAGACVIVSPVSPSKRWSFSSGSVRLTMSPGLTRWSESTIATTS